MKVIDKMVRGIKNIVQLDGSTYRVLVYVQLIILLLLLILISFLFFTAKF